MERLGEVADQVWGRASLPDVHRSFPHPFEPQLKQAALRVPSSGRMPICRVVQFLFWLNLTSFLRVDTVRRRFRIVTVIGDA